MAPHLHSLALLLLGAILFFSAPSDAAFFLRPRFFADVVRCADTTWQTSGAGTCGGDSLTTGVGSNIGLNSFSGSASVSLKGASALNLYEVAYLPVGLPSASAITIGQVCTDASGNAKQLIKNMATAADCVRAISMPAIVGADVYAKVSPTSAGVFLFYSRGPWAHDTNGDGTIDNYNTVNSDADSSPNAALPNPAVVAGQRVQFLSGWAS